jgi:hypothetical protein
MLIGFIDGDGTIQDRKITKVKFVGIKCHSSWLQILNLFIERLSDQVGVKIPVGKINARGYARVFITNNIHIKYLKNKAIEFNLPILTRKWDKIDLNFVSKQEYTPILNKKIKELSSAGMKNNLIAKELQVSESTVSNHLKIQN